MMVLTSGLGWETNVKSDMTPPPVSKLTVMMYRVPFFPEPLVTAIIQNLFAEIWIFHFCQNGSLVVPGENLGAPAPLRAVPH
jgi:hypothetical protein